ncbi:MAG: PSD1 domain-containing protein [Verrucomicrobia bacterium]|nr:PSD1 domain-containing protein [Verrucomicrobiota bacterium]
MTFPPALPRSRRLATALLGSALAASAPAAVDFNSQIRPLLNQNCTACHGGVKAAGNISFVYRESAMGVGKKSGRRVIVTGDPAGSELIARITSTDHDYRMPPAEKGPPLPPEKIELLRQWIKEGADWQEHWAFVPPKARPVPKVAGTPRPIDAFIHARLAKEGLMPAPEAPRAALLRRAALDLTGLPPTPEEISAFLADPASGAYEKQIDRLLASPRFGERWTSLWLDLARYADTKGYEKDAERQVWQYRDWLIDAFNRNLPYDQFIIEQLAGDLLPNPTLDQIVATSFHRQTQVNDEGGTDDEEYRTAAVIDRVATTWAVTNGLTFNCVQCHSHPYEPIKHGEYYRFFAFFNGTRDADFNSDYPTARIPNDPARHAEAWALQREVERLRHEVVTAGLAAEADRAQWRTLPLAAAEATPIGEMKLRGDELEVAGTVQTNVRYDLTIPALALSQDPLTALRFEALPLDPATARHTPERGFIVTQIEVMLARPDGSVQPLAVERFFPDTENLTTKATKNVPATASPADPAATVARAPAAKKGKAATKSKAATASSSSTAGATPTASPAPPPTETRDVTLDFHFAANPTIAGPRWVVAALREPLAAPPGSTLRIAITHGRGITEKPAPIRRLRVAASADARWTALATDTGLARKAARVTDALAELARLPGIDLPVMAELPRSESRETRLFNRGNFLTKEGNPLTPATPSLFPPLPAGEPLNRLTVARWFFAPGQPLTARVAVNRFWEQLFGTGLVETLEDFGGAGEKPSHPELLDWLSLHFQNDLRWDMKALLRELVTSATYQQAATATPDLLARDPRNRLLARGPRQRLTAEMVRDQALAASGLLSPKLHGPPVMPSQPVGVWETVYNNSKWTESKGDDAHRRAVYTYWKRSASYPSFLTFDMPGRDLCLARRTPTNTPLQALVTLNDAAYAEAATALAQRTLREATDTDARLARAFALVVSRPPTASETARLRRLHDEALVAVPTPKPANATTTDSTAEKPAASDSDPRAVAALTSVAAAILNLDAALVR